MPTLHFLHFTLPECSFMWNLWSSWWEWKAMTQKGHRNPIWVVGWTCLSSCKVNIFKLRLSVRKRIVLSLTFFIFYSIVPFNFWSLQLHFFLNIFCKIYPVHVSFLFIYHAVIIHHHNFIQDDINLATLGSILKE